MPHSTDNHRSVTAQNLEGAAFSRKTLGACPAGRNHKRPFTFLSAALTACTLAPMPAWTLPEDTQEPIHIHAESAEIEQQEGRIVYVGAVRVEQGTLRVAAEHMVVDYDAGKVVRITATGAPARYRQALRDDAGEVQAAAATIVYHTRESRIDLAGNANLEQRGSSLSGEHIRYDIVAGRVAAGSPTQGSIQTTLMPAAPENP